MVVVPAHPFAGIIRQQNITSQVPHGRAPTLRRCVFDMSIAEACHCSPVMVFPGEAVLVQPHGGSKTIAEIGIIVRHCNHICWRGNAGRALTHPEGERTRIGTEYGTPKQWDGIQAEPLGIFSWIRWLNPSCAFKVHHVALIWKDPRNSINDDVPGVPICRYSVVRSGLTRTQESGGVPTQVGQQPWRPSKWREFLHGFCSQHPSGR